MFYFDVYVVSAYLRIVCEQCAASPTAMLLQLGCGLLDYNLITLSVTLRADQRVRSVSAGNRHSQSWIRIARGSRR